MGDESILHVAMLPWLAFGHMNPFIHLAAALSDAGLRISFLCTPTNNRRLAQLLPPHLLARINFVDLPLPPISGLRPQTEATVDATADEIQHLKTAYDLLQQPISCFIADSAPDFLIHDSLTHWASAFGVPCILFSVFSAATLAFWGPPEASTEEGRLRWKSMPQSLTEPPEWIPFPSTVAFRRREAAIFYAGFFVENASGVNDADRIRLAFEGCQAVAVRSCTEYEGEYLELLPRLYGKTVLTLGLLPPDAAQPLFHSGWGSVIETMAYGHAMVLLPSMVDQGLNARLLVEKGLAVEVERSDDDDGLFKGEDIATTLNTSMTFDEGEGWRMKAREMVNVFADREIHANYVEGFVNYLLKAKGGN